MPTTLRRMPPSHCKVRLPLRVFQRYAQVTWTLSLTATHLNRGLAGKVQFRSIGFCSPVGSIICPLHDNCCSAALAVPLSVVSNKKPPAANAVTFIILSAFIGPNFSGCHGLSGRKYTPDIHFHVAKYLTVQNIY